MALNNLDNQTAIYNGKEVKVLSNSVARDSYITILLDDGSSKIVRKDALLFNFNNKQGDYKALMDVIEKEEDEIKEGQLLMASYMKAHDTQRNLMIFNRQEKNKVLSRAGVSLASELSGKDAEEYNYYKNEQYTAQAGMHRATSDILSTSISLISDILNNGKLKLQAIMMRDNYPIA